MLVERSGHYDACLMIAGGFTAVDLLAVLVVRTREHEKKMCREQKVGPKVDKRRAPNPQVAPQPVYARRMDGPLTHTTSP